MKYFIWSVLFLTLASAQAKLNVVATLPDLGAIARAIGGDRVQVVILARPTEDPHFVEPKPSFLVALKQADLLMEGGAELETGWLNPLLESSRNKKILAGGPGRFNASQGIKMLDVPVGKIDRSQGDVHPAGNPHYLLNPQNGLIVAEGITRKLAELDAPNQSFFQENLKAFQADFKAHDASWKEKRNLWRQMKVITYHKSFEYLAEYLEFEIVGQVEPKPGVEPSPSHIKGLVALAKEKAVKLLIMEPNRSRRTAESVTKPAGAKLVMIPSMVGAQPRAKGYFDYFDYVIGEINNGLK